MRPLAPANLLLLFLIAGHPSNTWADSDVIGIHPGMDFSAAGERIKEVIPGATPLTVPADVKDVQNSRIRGWKYPASVSAQRGQLEQIWVQGLAPPHEGVVAGVFRNVIPQGNERMLASDLKAAFVDKYGPIVLEHEIVPGMSLFWSWTTNANDHPITSWETVLRCANPDATTAGAPMRTNLMMASRISDAATYANGNYVDCHNFMVAQVLVDGSGVVQIYRTLLWDLGLIQESNLDTVAATVAEAEEIQAERMRELKNANKPTL